MVNELQATSAPSASSDIPPKSKAPSDPAFEGGMKARTHRRFWRQGQPGPDVPPPPCSRQQTPHSRLSQPPRPLTHTQLPSSRFQKVARRRMSIVSGASLRVQCPPQYLASLLPPLNRCHMSPALWCSRCTWKAMALRYGFLEVRFGRCTWSSGPARWPKRRWPGPFWFSSKSHKGCAGAVCRFQCVETKTGICTQEKEPNRRQSWVGQKGSRKNQYGKGQRERFLPF